MPARMVGHDLPQDFPTASDFVALLVTICPRIFRQHRTSWDLWSRFPPGFSDSIALCGTFGHDLPQDFPTKSHFVWLLVTIWHKILRQHRTLWDFWSRFAPGFFDSIALCGTFGHDLPQDFLRKCYRRITLPFLFDERTNERTTYVTSFSVRPLWKTPPHGLRYRFTHRQAKLSACEL